jgi:hypothetical protein
MNGPLVNQPMACRASRALLRALLPLTTTRFRDWGAAMFAELESINDPIESIRWTMGCLAITLREVVVSCCLGACRGAGVWITAKGEGSYMRTLRIASVLGALAVLSFFMAPSFRQAMSVAADSFHGPAWSYHRDSFGEQERNRLRAIAERDRDAKTLAYVALYDDDLVIAGQDADHAVALDPRWTWLYYVLLNRDMGWPYQPHPQGALWEAKLRQWDPQNAVIYLLDAQRALLEAQRNQPSAPGRPSSRLADWSTKNPLWLEKMARAFASPKYDTYFENRFNLERDIARQHGSNNPLRLAMSIVSHPMPNIIRSIQYEKFILNRADDSSDLAREAGRVTAFGERMTTADTEIEQIVGQTIALDGYRKLQSMAAPGDREVISAQIAALEAKQRANVQSFQFGIVYAFAYNALIVQSCFVLVSFAAVVMVIAAMLFVFRRLRGSRAITVVSCAAVGLMLFACVAGFVGYLPYSRLVAQAMDPRISVKASLPLLESLFSFGVSYPQFLLRPETRVYGWIILLILLSLTGLWLVIRQLRKPPSRPPALVSAP